MPRRRKGSWEFFIVRDHDFSLGDDADDLLGDGKMYWGGYDDTFFAFRTCGKPVDFREGTADAQAVLLAAKYPRLIGKLQIALEFVPAPKEPRKRKRAGGVSSDSTVDGGPAK